MAYKAKLTEHAGPKKGRGGYAGRKRDAKPESNKLRRRLAATIIMTEAGTHQSNRSRTIGSDK